MMVYFSASIYQRKEYGAYYKRIVSWLENKGYKVKHDHITSAPDLEKISKSPKEENEAYYKNAVKWMMNADLIVIEASFPSTLNIGHEISVGLEKGKPVVVMFEKGKSSAFLDGLNSDRLLLIEYDDANLEEMLEEAVDFAKNQADTRFNFFISPRHSTYLDWISQHRRIPRSVYLRNLIKRDMEENPDFAAA
jgi:hypothetical protein